jgi:hypothetical protein
MTPPWGGLRCASRCRQGVAGPLHGGTTGLCGGGAVCATVRRLAPPMQVNNLLMSSSASLAAGVEAQ